jgi:hypothetical protein
MRVFVRLPWIDTMFVAHAKNYLDVEPKLPPPLYAPEIAADAILYAAEHPKRDLYVGGGAKLLGMGAYYMPHMMDAGMKRFMFKLQKTGQPPHSRDQHNLYTHSKDLQQRGGIAGRVHETSWYTSAATHPKATSAFVIGIGASFSLAAIWASRLGSAKRNAPFPLKN